nr:hypothetical protein [Tanacetum cinerariifolium]
MLIQHQAKVGEGSGQPIEPQHTPTTTSSPHIIPIPTVASSSQPKKIQKHMKTKRKVTKISQSSGPTTLVADETVHEERRDRMKRAITIVASLDAEQDSGTMNKTQSPTIPNEPIPQGTGSVLALENNKTAQDLEITHLNKRVKRLEKKRKSRTPQLKRRLLKVRIESSAKKSLDDQEDASNQGRNDQDEEISFVQDVEIDRKKMHYTCASCVSRSLGESIMAIGEDFASSDAILSLKSCCKLVGLANLASQVGWGSGQEGFLGKLLSGDEGVHVCNLGGKNGYRVQCFKRRGDRVRV